MKLNPYLTFNGQCESALKFYETCLGGQILMMMTYGDSPLAKQMPLEWEKKIIHATFALVIRPWELGTSRQRVIRNRRAFL